MNLFKQQRPQADSSQIGQLKTWTQAALDLSADIPVSISQLQCQEPGCPPLETVITVMTQPPQMFKIHRAASEITFAEVQHAIRSAPQHPPD
ncbi:hypothetical protein [Almyronema epifaneia]|uniref:Nitrate reductase n=1 Tax=Almyronema epifaneia S1 TaxID=2991925 RepID=A0ABW6IJJ8_9CYAN